MYSKRHSHSLQLSGLWGFCDVTEQMKVEWAKLLELLKQIRLNAYNKTK